MTKQDGAHPTKTWQVGRALGFFTQLGVPWSATEKVELVEEKIIWSGDEFMHI